MKPGFLKTDNTESFKTKWFRRMMNWYPMYIGSGGHILFWSGDSLEVHLRLRLSLWSRNYVGTIFGGSLFSAADPFYMIMLIKALGPAYVVWDKTAHIRFKKPAKTTLYAVLKIMPEDLSGIRNMVKECGHATKTFSIRWLDEDQVVHAEIERQCYVADKEFYVRKKGDTQTARF